MSIAPCARCGTRIDTDAVGDYLTLGTDVYCERHACCYCGERVATCDDECVQCHAEFLIANPDEYESGPTYLLPNWREAERIFLESRRSKA